MLLAPEASGASDLKAGPNPYLAGFDLPSPPATINVLPAPPGQGFFPVDLGEPARAPVFSGADQRPPDSPHALIPDFAQPSEDDKYFPQLKKF
jgi:hypothetical protein